MLSPNNLSKLSRWVWTKLFSTSKILIVGTEVPVWVESQFAGSKEQYGSYHCSCFYSYSSYCSKEQYGRLATTTAPAPATTHQGSLTFKNHNILRAAAESINSKGL